MGELWCLDPCASVPRRHYSQADLGCGPGWRVGGCRASCDTGRAWGQHGGGPPAAVRGEAASCVTAIIQWGSGDRSYAQCFLGRNHLPGCRFSLHSVTIPVSLSDNFLLIPPVALRPPSLVWLTGVCFLHPGVMSILARAHGSSIFPWGLALPVAWEVQRLRPLCLPLARLCPRTPFYCHPMKGLWGGGRVRSEHGETSFLLILGSGDLSIPIRASLVTSCLYESPGSPVPGLKQDQGHSVPAVETHSHTSFPEA